MPLKHPELTKFSAQLSYVKGRNQGRARGQPLLKYLLLWSIYLLEERLAQLGLVRGKEQGHQNWTLGLCGLNVNLQKAVSWGRSRKSKWGTPGIKYGHGSQQV